MNPMCRICAILLVLLMTSSAVLAEDEEVSPPVPTTYNYYEISPSLVANLARGGKYIRTDIQLMTNDEGFKEELALHGPAIRHTLLLLFSEQDGKAIKTPNGKEALRQEALASINSLMQELSDKGSVHALFFTTFFVQ